MKRRTRQWECEPLETCAMMHGNPMWDGAIEEIARTQVAETVQVEADDHGNAADAATRITVNSVVQGKIDDPRDVDWFRFEAREGNRYTALTRLNSLRDSVLRLIDSDGTTVLKYNDDAVDLASEIVWTATGDGVYFLEVSGFSFAEGTYSLELTQAVVYAIGDTNLDRHVDTADIDYLYRQIQSNGSEPNCDLNRDHRVDGEDVQMLVESVLGTAFGDANLDGLVNSSDLVYVLGNGEYADEIPDNSTWTEGDWNGDQEFDSSDLQLMLQNGRFVASEDDSYEENDSRDQAFDLGLVDAPIQIEGLRLLDRQDWFQFRLGRPVDSGHVTIDFDHGQGDLEMRLYDAGGRTIAEASTVTNLERIALQRLPAGNYFLQVYGYRGSQNPSYSLEIDAGRVRESGLGRTLWLNFDGADIAYENLLQWSFDWEAPLDWLDPDEDGVVVRPFLESTYGAEHREAVIEQIIAHVSEDLAPFNVDVRRTMGMAVVDRFETTVFVGRNPVGHQAGDIDYGNDNHTDVAFVTDEWWLTVEETALTLADVILHEAGHTFGLFHVNTMIDQVAMPETMGLRYSETNSSRWVQDTAFLDRTFVEFLDHGDGRGVQNSYQTLLQNFGLTEDPAYTEGDQVAAVGSRNMDLPVSRRLGAGLLDPSAVDATFDKAGEALWKCH